MKPMPPHLSGSAMQHVAEAQLATLLLHIVASTPVFFFIPAAHE
jgi:hypothetical protein